MTDTPTTPQTSEALRHEFDEWCRATEFSRSTTRPVDAGDQQALRDAYDLLDDLFAIHAALRAERDALRSLAKQAINGWACYARRKIEHDDIARLHREVDALSASPEAPSAKERP